MKEYFIKYQKSDPKEYGWNEKSFKDTTSLDIAITEKGSTLYDDYNPKTLCKMFYNEKGMHGLFQVQDKFIRCVHTKYQDMVCRDSCVEFFVQPPGDHGYFNFEFNCGGNILLYHVRKTDKDCRIIEQDIIPENELSLIKTFPSLPAIVEPEITEETIWTLGFFIPWKFFIARNIIKDNKVKNQVWRANFYKCGGQTSRPHAYSWNELNNQSFHNPACFGKINFTQKVEE
jgi:hypothetical protein